MAESKKQPQVVTAPLVVAKRADGSDVYLYRGAPLPDGLAEGEEKRLADFLGAAEDLAGVGNDATAGSDASEK